MEPVVNSFIGMLILIYHLIRGVGEWAGGAVLTALGAAAGTYLGFRAAHRNRTPEPLNPVTP